MSDRPPPYPADVLAKGWRFELDMEKFKRSDTWKLAKTPMLRGALLLLWAEAWQERPCGTLPDDDELIALMVGMEPDEYARHRSVIRRGWVLAGDGRLYHETITERVLAMMEKRAKDARRAASNRARAADARVSDCGVTSASRVTTPGLGPEFDTKHQAPSTTPEADASGGTSKSPRPVRKCPERFAVTAQMREWAAIEAPGVDVDAETAKFRDHTFRTAISDWGGTWRNWVRRAFENRPRGAVTPLNRQEAIEQRNREVGDRWLRNQEALDAQH